MIFKVISWVAVIPAVASAALAIGMLSVDGAAVVLASTTLEGDFPEPAGLARWQLMTWAGAIAMLTLAALTWLVWIYFATRFLRIVQAEPLHYGPLSAVILHFLPIVSYVMPMLIMSELERATRDPMQWRYLPASWLPATSWLVGKLSIIAIPLSATFQENAETPHQYAMGLWLMVVATVGCLAGISLINRFLSHMERLQMALAVKIGGAQGEAAA